MIGDVDAAGQFVHDVLADGQAKARAGVLLIRAGEAHIFVEDRRLLVDGDPVAMVAHAHEGFVRPYAVFDLDPGRLGAAARRAVLEGIVDDQADGAAAEHRVGAQLVLRGQRADIDLAAGFQRSKPRQRIVDQLRQARHLEARLDGVGLELGHVEDVGDEVVEPESFGQGRGNQRLLFFFR